VFYSLRKKLNLLYFNARTNQIRKVAKVEMDPESNLTIVTLLCDTDVNMYLLAIFSFCRFVKPKQIIVVSDNLSGESCDVLRACVNGINILPVDDFREEGLPIGSCWERLACILRHAEESYVMQLDADTITFKRPDEVVDAIRRNVSFTIVSNPDCRKMTFKEMSDYISSWKQTHVQVEAEKALGKCKNPETRFYARACAAFTGFAKQESAMVVLKDFSSEIESIIGRDKWSEWGSEQVASNYIVSNNKDSILLPFENYPFYSPLQPRDEEKVKLYHFLGTHRFKKGRYLACAKDIIESL
jgi:hypothetical protein